MNRHYKTEEADTPSSRDGLADGSSPTRSLSVKLLILTVAFIMLAEILIFVPSIANFRNVWLQTHLETAEAASIVFLDSDEIMLSRDAGLQLLKTTKSRTIAVRRDGRSQLIAALPIEGEIREHIDLDNSSAFGSIRSAFAMLAAPPDSMYRVFGSIYSGNGEIELVQKASYLQEAMWVYCRNILLLSLLISIFAAGLVYLSLYRLIVMPIVRVSTNMDEFSKSPETPTLVFKPTGRRDEIGLVEHRLSSFQRDLQNTLRQKKRLAELGLAVSKINHDLRNILASAQLFSDRLSALPDPTVQRLAPKLIRAIDRAADYTRSVIAYGKALEAPPRRRRLLLHPIVDEVAEILGLDQSKEILWQNRVETEFEADADPEHLFRILLNLCRNACQAVADKEDLEALPQLHVSAVKNGEVCEIRVSDTGPGIPEKVRGKLFTAFEGTTRSGGTGLGLSIALELANAHGGHIEIEKTGASGTTIMISIPYRSEELPDQEL